MSFRELILSGSIFERSVLLESPSSLHVMLTGFLRARLQDDDGDRINVLMKRNLDHEDCVSPRSPFHLTLRLNLGTRFLFSGGELSHP